MRAAALLGLAAPLALAGCGGAEDQTGGVTAEEARALDEAAEMIEERRLPDAALAKPQAAPEPSGPKPNGAPE